MIFLNLHFNNFLRNNLNYKILYTPNIKFLKNHKVEFIFYNIHLYNSFEIYYSNYFIMLIDL